MSEEIPNDPYKLVERKSLNEALATELRSISDSAMEKDPEGFYDRCGELAERIRAEFPDFQEYEAYHILNRGGLKRDPQFFDFPGEYSVEKFLREQD